MMDGRIGAIRQALEDHAYKNTLIMAYSAKYASAFYGRSGKPSFVGYAEGRQAHLSDGPRQFRLSPARGEFDLAKAPTYHGQAGMPYLYILRRIKDQFSAPTSSIRVRRICDADGRGRHGWLDRDRVMLESLTAFKRAGADGILTYFARDAAKLLLRRGE